MEDQSIFFDSNLISQSDVIWPGKCVVCGRLCNEYIGVKAISANPMALSEFSPTRKFPVCVHNQTYACGSHFLKQWVIAKFSGLIFEIMTLVITVIVAYFLHPYLPAYSFIILFSVLFAFAIGGGMAIERKMRPEVWIKETLPTRLMGKVGYKFIFRDKQYAQEFEQLNCRLLAGR